VEQTLQDYGPRPPARGVGHARVSGRAGRLTVKIWRLSPRPPECTGQLPSFGPTCRPFSPPFGPRSDQGGGAAGRHPGAAASRAAPMAPPPAHPAPRAASADHAPPLRTAARPTALPPRPSPTSEKDTELAPKLGQLQPFLNCIPAGTHGRTCIVCANLTPLSLAAVMSAR
jgi:hypothetical protein